MGGSATDVNLVPLSRIVDCQVKTSTTPGTPVYLVATNVGCSSICVKALSTNSGLVNVGKLGAVNFELGSKESITLDIDNIRDIQIDVTVSGEGVCWIALG